MEMKTGFITQITNGVPWKDTHGNNIEAHGGGFIEVGEYYYWFGENRKGRTKVSCYRSKDLIRWEYRNDVLTVDSSFEPISFPTHPELIFPDSVENDLGIGANVERPKVIYNEKTGRYVMWMHWENGKDYKEARCAIASCSAIDGNYTYHGSFNPLGFMSRDCTLYKEDDGTAYFISAARDNADMHIYMLTPDYLGIDKHVNTLWLGAHREAPALFKNNGYYYMVTSGCTGWPPNQLKYSFTSSIEGEWSPLMNLGGYTGYDTQPTYVLTLKGTAETALLYVSDRWSPADYYCSTYAFLQIRLSDDKALMMDWADKIVVDVTSGKVSTEQHDSGLWRIRSLRNMYYLIVVSDNISNVKTKPLDYLLDSQKWAVETDDSVFVKIRSLINGKYLTLTLGSLNKDTEVVLADATGHSCQQWRIIRDPADEVHKLMNCYTGNVMESTDSGAVACRPNLPDENTIWNKQGFALTKVYEAD